MLFFIVLFTFMFSAFSINIKLTKTIANDRNLIEKIKEGKGKGKF